MRNIAYIGCLVTAAMMLSCQNTKQDNQSADEPYQFSDSAWCDTTDVSDTIRIKYAKGLAVDYRNDGIHVTITNPDPKARHSKKEELVITKPSRRFVCTTALQLGNFEVLGLENRIVGINTLRNLFSQRIKEQLEQGSTKTIGKEGNFDVETVVALKPDFILVSASKHGGFEVLKDCNVPLISHHGYKETSPLGQAEWIKLVGLLTGETRRANAVFNNIERKYRSLVSKVQKAEGRKRPTIMSGRQIRDGWYYVGGQSYMAQIFADAGADYIMKDNTESGGVTEDFEKVYAQSLKADFWQTDGAHNGDFTLATLAAEDERYAAMEAFKTKSVIFCNLSQTPYRELGGVQPHYILADFVKAIHPHLLPHYTPKYYKLLADE